ncbi:MAG: hypothetical protein JKY56_03395 [Kofleriaceae bacterium]|nr:hypothetical protein [Kofleriaceae bacterium]
MRFRTARKLAASGDFKAAHDEVDEATRLGVQFCMTDRWEYFVSKAQLFDEESKPGAAGNGAASE